MLHKYDFNVTYLLEMNFFRKNTGLSEQQFFGEFLSFELLISNSGEMKSHTSEISKKNRLVNV